MVELNDDNKDKDLNSFQEIDAEEHDDGSHTRSFSDLNEEEHDNGEITLSEK